MRSVSRRYIYTDILWKLGIFYCTYTLISIFWRVLDICNKEFGLFYLFFRKAYKLVEKLPSYMLQFPGLLLSLWFTYTKSCGKPKALVFLTVWPERSLFCRQSWEEGTMFLKNLSSGKKILLWNTRTKIFKWKRLAFIWVVMHTVWLFLRWGSIVEMLKPRTCSFIQVPYYCNRNCIGRNKY